MNKINYGIDAPGVIRNLFIASAVGFIVPFTLPSIPVGPIVFDTSGFVWMGVCCGFMAVWMLVYSTYGKKLHRDRLLRLYDWKGNEQVLDVGTGAGLMMIGAAKKIRTGKVTGIDIWNSEDLTDNSGAITKSNAVLEGVFDRVEILNMNATALTFDNNSFDCILSNLCLHNLYVFAERQKACDEIYRVLKPGGKAIISDFKHMSEYKTRFEQSGARCTMQRANYLTTFPPLGVLIVEKV